MPRLSGVMRGLVSGLGLMALAGCLSVPPQTGARDQSVPMSSLAAFDAARFSGRWYEVQAFAPENASCVIGAVTFSRQSSDDLIVTEGPCADAAPRTGVAQRIAPGRFVFDGEELWVLWVDQSYAAAVIATPAGAAHILSRRLDIAADKLQAARDILDWNGFDVTRLRETRRR